MGLVGFGIAALTSWGARGNRTHVAMVAVLTAFVLRFPRDESASLVRAVVWSCVATCRHCGPDSPGRPVARSRNPPGAEPINCDRSRRDHLGLGPFWSSVNATLSARRVEFDRPSSAKGSTGSGHRVVVALEQRFERTPDGIVWGPGTFSPEFWGRYLEAFDKVTVVARIRPVRAPSARFERCDAEAVEFLAVLHYLGPWEFLQRWRTVRDAALAGLDRDCSVIVRIPHRSDRSSSATCNASASLTPSR